MIVINRIYEYGTEEGMEVVAVVEMCLKYLHMVDLNMVVQCPYVIAVVVPVHHLYVPVVLTRGQPKLLAAS